MTFFRANAWPLNFSRTPTFTAQKQKGMRESDGSCVRFSHIKNHDLNSLVIAGGVGVSGINKMWVGGSYLALHCSSCQLHNVVHGQTIIQ
jgi:hypothetical protein